MNEQTVRNGAPDLIQAVRNVVQSIDGSYGKTWGQLADELDEQDDKVPVGIDAGALADLVRMADKYGAVGR